MRASFLRTRLNPVEGGTAGEGAPNHPVRHNGERDDAWICWKEQRMHPVRRYRPFRRSFRVSSAKNNVSGHDVSIRQPLFKGKVLMCYQRGEKERAELASYVVVSPCLRIEL